MHFEVNLFSITLRGLCLGCGVLELFEKNSLPGTIALNHPTLCREGSADKQGQAFFQQMSHNYNKTDSWPKFPRPTKDAWKSFSEERGCHAIHHVLEIQFYLSFDANPKHNASSNYLFLDEWRKELKQRRRPR